MRIWLLATFLALEPTVVARTQAEPGSAPAIARPTRLERSLPFPTLNGFVENRGQWPAEVRFFASRGSIDATLLADALVLRPQPDGETGEWLPPVVLRFPAAQEVAGQGALPTAHHFILAEGSASDVPGFERVIYRAVVPGIDLVVRLDGPWFAYDLHVAPGADLGGLRIELEGAISHELVVGGVLAMETASGRVEQRIGASWEIDGSGVKLPVPSSFRVIDSEAGRLTLGFEAQRHDPTRPFVLDPSLVWSTYVGGTSQELVEDVAVAPDGSVYLAVKSSSAGPTTPGAFITTKPAGSNGWAGKLSTDGSTLEWGTFLGGSDTEQVCGIELDQDGTTVVVGSTWSPDFPTTPASLQPSFGGGINDIFISRLLPDGSGLAWSTFYGGSDWELADTSALFPSGDLVIVGHPDPSSTDPPAATLGAFDTTFDASDYLLTRIAGDGSHVVFQTYFAAHVLDLVCDEAAIVFGGKAGPSLPATPGTFQSTLGPSDLGSGFIAKLDAEGADLLWATFLGGDEGSDTVHGVTVDAAGAIYVAGYTDSVDFPVTSGAFDSTSSEPNGAGFVCKLLPGGTGLVWSTFIGACCSGTTMQWDIAVDRAGNAISVGSSNQPNFPTTPDAFKPTYTGPSPFGDANLTKFDVFGETLIYSTYLGGGSSPHIGLDTNQDPYVGLEVGSGFPVTAGAYDTTFAGSTDGAAMKFDFDLLPWQVMGGGLVGSVDTPNLAGTGKLFPSTPARLSVRGAAASSPASIIVGLTAANFPFKGGTMVPFPTLILTLATSAQGALDLPFTWTNVPAGINLYIQVWIKDVGAPTGFSATNALRMTSQ